jgi:hypothetical protein
MDSYVTERDAARAKAHEKYKAAKEKMREEISKLLTEQGVAYEWPEQSDERFPKCWIIVNGENVGIVMARTRSYGIGKLVIRVGNSGNRTSFPIRKSGTFNYAKIVEGLVGRAEGAKRSREHQEKEMQAHRMASKAGNEFREEFGLTSWGVTARPGYGDKEPTLEIKLKLSPDQMREAMRRLGDLAPGKKE